MQEIITDYVRLKQKIASKEEEVKELKRDFNEISASLYNVWETEGVQSQKVDVDGTRYTVFRTQSLQASIPADKRAAAIAACEAIGLDEYVETSVSTSKLKAYINEQLNQDRKDGEPYDFDKIDSELKDVVRLFVQKKVGVRKG